ncbi:putative F-box domain, leucine-rich repeat domain superfamily, F-box-like domain superfamily [Helianthus annuus]|uniref:F-box domain, leucine-rich repeat domain superfamily, F-box-like domain superfamily n=1 Tax=Helianthus annuus TaxID=4232 RepID=A0A251TSA5_HELAN|nr:F-box protein SKIP1 [Helianthus annuus]KAF5789440.1 putative F-box domain, leucine-rich repeat domain superfamily, F-box-like domain superfamily [Helianthus annuus]KAJ0524789.1 putative F-box domain, leucine-rich repeat domain superfamily, F-box-like domain superfamily [Helianthus annuus]KAJ0532749.1 putative F-box domain, leucine-rich repeat domain superfamily, F-box-like domain superfamily [Helianthus annuus]KAJ0541161.1 putative F-box domain, leucine-rich repeat domain superfamily, F-box-
MSTTTESDQLTSNWSELTHEILLNILTRLTLEDRWNGTMLVCKSWLQASKDPSLHSVFDLESSFKSRPVESTRWWTPEFERKIDNMIRSVVDWSEGKIVEVRVRHCSDRALSVVAQRCPNLEVLSIKSCPNVTDESMIKIASGCPKLKELDMSYCYEISHESIQALGRKCTNISILKRNLMNWLDPSEHIGIVPTSYLNACPQDGDSEAAAIGNLMPQLLHLELRFSKLTARGLALISQGCKNLEYLDLSGCVSVTSRDIENSTSGLTNLKNVKKNNFYIPRSASVHAERYGHWRLYDERFQTDAFRL